MRAELRVAIKRLMQAVSQTAVTVTILRRDLEILMLVKSQAPEIQPMPTLHPEQH